MKKEFFFEGTSRFPFLTKKIESSELEKRPQDLVVYDGRIKSVTVAELLSQNPTGPLKNILESLKPTQLIILNYVVQIEDESLLGDTGNEEINVFMTEINDRYFHAQYFLFMYFDMIENVTKKMEKKSFWDISTRDKLFQCTMACYIGVLRKEYPFKTEGMSVYFEGLPEKDEGKLFIIYES